MLPVVSREFCQKRLELIFPPGAFPSELMGILAGTTVAGMLWAGCVMPEGIKTIGPGLPYARPTTVLWLNEQLMAIEDEPRRSSWHEASLQGHLKAQDLEKSWGVTDLQWYKDNTRESVRDEILSVWEQLGPVLADPAVQTTSSKARWILQREFAELFDPGLSGDELDTAVSSWIEEHMSANGRLRASIARSRAQANVSVTVTLPAGSQRELKPGNSSLLIKGTVEIWAQLRLKDPAVIAISESADKLNFVDSKLLEAVGISIDVSTLLPDLLLADTGTNPLEFWIIEVVATGGPIDERRKSKLTKWAVNHGLKEEQLRFLTVFLSRHHPAAKKFVPTLATGTHAWFLDEPESELTWGNIVSEIPENVVPLRMI